MSLLNQHCEFFLGYAKMYVYIDATGKAVRHSDISTKELGAVA